MRHVSTVIPAALLTSAALAGDGRDLCPAPGSCEVPHPTPGCNQIECCNAVCDMDPFCCEAEWDRLCAAHASAMCRIRSCLWCPAQGECLVPHLGGGCNQGGCCATVCGADPFCCEVQWDEDCAQEAFGVPTCSWAGCPFLDDEVVDGGDIAVILGSWGPCPCDQNCPADLNLDFEVNGADIAIILGEWGLRGGCG